MPECTCATCRAERSVLGKLTDDQLAALGDDLARLGVFLKADDGSDWSEEELWLDETDADIMSSIFAVFEGEAGPLSVRSRNGVQITEQDYKEAVARMQAQRDIGLALLSVGAAKRLAPVLDSLNEHLAEMAKGNINPIQFGARLQTTLRDVATAMGPEGPKGFDTSVYSPYEWSRLCRTEAAFARTEAERETIKQEWGASSEALDTLGYPPIHPQCMCAIGVWEDADGKLWMIAETTPTACEECNDWADMVAEFVGAM